MLLSRLSKLMVTQYCQCSACIPLGSALESSRSTRTLGFSCWEQYLVWRPRDSVCSPLSGVPAAMPFLKIELALDTHISICVLVFMAVIHVPLPASWDLIQLNRVLSRFLPSLTVQEDNCHSQLYSMSGSLPRVLNLTMVKKKTRERNWSTQFVY